MPKEKSTGRLLGLIHCFNYVFVSPATSQESSQADNELQEVKDHLHTTEQKNAELTEQLNIANANVENYRVVVLTLEETLKEEKEVFLKYVNVYLHLDTILFMLTASYRP